MWELRLFCCGPKRGYHFKIDLFNSGDFCVNLKPLLVPSSKESSWVCFCKLVWWHESYLLKGLSWTPGCLSAIEPVVAIWIWESFSQMSVDPGLPLLVCVWQDEHLPCLVAMVNFQLSIFGVHDLMPLSYLFLSTIRSETWKCSMKNQIAHHHNKPSQNNRRIARGKS